MSSRLPRLRSIATGVLAVAVPAALAVAVAAPAASARTHGHDNEFRQTNLVSDLNTVGAQVVDPNLKNPWGLAFGPTTPLWVADNGTSIAGVYPVSPAGPTAQPSRLDVTLPPADSAPTGQVFNPTGDFVVKSKAGMGPALFIFSSEGGQIIAWNPAADPVVNGKSTAQTEFSSKTAVYKGLAIASTRFGTFLYASNFHDNRVDVFNTRFHRVHLFGDFRDRHLPRGYAPFGIRAINGFIYVTYAKQDADRHDDVAGPGHGFIDVFTPSGFLVERLVSRGALDSPWGLEVAPRGFGPFGGKLLVGNFGNGRIHAYGLFSGRPDGTLRTEHHKPVTIDGLWALQFGTATTGGTGTLLFSAGLNGEADGLVGAINPAH
ncbi:MAG TPA: TIGR03118 family protein [Streptosporangiaceae bacterium]|nr:TIGR03118 family protein [Streptosporangiaceae bacterium]